MMRVCPKCSQAAGLATAAMTPCVMSTQVTPKLSLTSNALASCQMTTTVLGCWGILPPWCVHLSQPSEESTFAPTMQVRDCLNPGILHCSCAYSQPPVMHKPAFGLLQANCPSVTLPQTIGSCRTCTWPSTTQSLSLTRPQNWHTSSRGCTWTDTARWRRHTSTASASCKSPAAKSRTSTHPTSQTAR